MQQLVVGAETLHRVQQCLIEGEQIVWTGKPEPVISLTLGSRFLHLVSKGGLPSFLVLVVIGFLIDSQFMLISSMVGAGLTGSVLLGMKQVKATPVAFEEYVLTNLRAFSHVNSNGTFILASIPLDMATSITRKRYGRNCTALFFTRPHGVTATSSQPIRPEKQPRSFVGFLNLKDADYPMRVAEWAAAQNNYLAA